MLAAKKRTDTERVVLDRVYHALGSVRALNPDATVSQVMALLYVAMKPNVKQTEIMRELTMRDSGQSSLISRLSVGDKRNPGLELIEGRDNPQDRRERLLELTNKGDIFVDTLISRLDPKRHHKED